VPVRENDSSISPGEGGSVGGVFKGEAQVCLGVQKLQGGEQGEDLIEAPQTELHHSQHEGAHQHSRERQFAR
jgi:hypothetical protein